MSALEQTRVVEPRRDVREGIGAGDEEQARRRIAVRREVLQRARRVRESAELEFDVGYLVLRVARQCQRHHRESVKRRCQRRSRTMWWNRGGHEEHAVQLQRAVSRRGRRQMTQMDWVERASQNAGAARHRSSVSTGRSYAASRSRVFASLNRFQTASISAGTPSPVTAEIG